MNKNDIEISSISYTNKDFGAIYPEILKLANQLTNKWDPSQSDESDPGVVLLKEAAFVADHNNYNIDKNILENFLPSATQDRSVRNITEMNGYTPRYYVAANGKVNINWKYNIESGEKDELFTIPAFTLVLTNDDESISYTQTSDISIQGDGIDSSGYFTEGTLQSLSINDSQIITLDNIDDNNRLYLPEVMVAQNGVYVKYHNDKNEVGYWKRNNYLLTQPAGSRVYKVDYDSELNLPYLEFPQDISNIIEDGLSISYISTTGSSGNVSAKKLTKIITPTQFNDLQGNIRYSENLNVSNPYAISNGKDPETIDEMYKSFKKIVGTFDTLVTCKDYINKVKELKDSNDNPLISNGFVTDRRNDYNKALNVITLDNNGEYFKNISLTRSVLEFKPNKVSCTSVGNMYSDGNNLYIVMVEGNEPVKVDEINLNDFSYLTSAMTPYDLAMYCLCAYSESEFNNLAYYNALEKSFKPISVETRDSIKYDIEDNKCLSHNYKDPIDGNIYCFKNYAPLNVTIIPYNKVSKLEASDIMTNIYKNISENYNPINLEFGEKLDAENIKKVIINSDDRIKDITLGTITYNTRVMDNSGDDEWTLLGSGWGPTKREGISEPQDSKYFISSDIWDQKTFIVDLISKNVLAGRICLLNIDEDFVYEYGQYDGKIYTLKGDTTHRIATELKLNLSNNQEIAVSTNKGDIVSWKVNSTWTEESGKSNISYVLEAPNYLQENLVKGDAYTLTGEDKFTVNMLDVSGNITDTQVYQSSTNNQIQIYNGLDGSADKSNIKKGIPTKYVQTSGYIGIKDINISKLTDEDKVNLPKYTLSENEVFQIIYPNYYSLESFGMYVYYRYENDDNPNNIIYADTEYELSGNEKLFLVYSVDGVSRTRKVVSGETIRSNFNIIVTDKSSTTGSIIDYEDGIMKSAKFISLSSNQEISTRAIMTTKLNGTNIKCFWITDTIIDGKCSLFESNKSERILGNNEYFMYSNLSLDEIVILGSGTKIVKSDGDSRNWWYVEKTDLSIQSITENGTSSPIPWKLVNFSANPLYITEMNIISLGEGDDVKITGWNENKLPQEMCIANEFIPCDAKITYTSNGTEVKLSSSVEEFYWVRTRLDINMGPGYPQELHKKEGGENAQGIQKIIIDKNSNEEIVIDPQNIDKSKERMLIQSSSLFEAIGDDDINLDGYNSLKIYKYISKNETFDEVVKVQSKAEKYEYPFFYNHENIYIIPVYVYGSEKDITARMYYIEENSAGEEVKNYINISDYNTETVGDKIVFKGNTLYNISPSGLLLDKVLYLEISWEQGTVSSIQLVTVKPVVVSTGLNKNLEITGKVTLQNITDRIKYLIKYSDNPSLKPLYTYIPDNSMMINNQDFSDPECLWDINNVANDKTIAQIDLRNSTFEISRNLRGW